MGLRTNSRRISVVISQDDAACLETVDHQRHLIVWEGCCIPIRLMSFLGHSGEQVARPCSDAAKSYVLVTHGQVYLSL